MRSDPGDRRAHRMEIVFSAESGKLRRGLGRPCFRVARLVHLVRGQSAGLVLEVLAGEEPARRRAVRKDGQPVGRRHWQELDFRLALHEVVHGLDRLQPRPAVAFLDAERRLRLPSGIVADARVQHLAGAHRVLERAHVLLKRRQRVVMVQIKDLDAVGSQPLQARVDGAAHVAARGAARVDVAAGRIEALRGDDQAFALASDQLAENFLGTALVVLVGGVEEIDSRVAAGAVHRGRRALVRIAAERHRAEAQLRDLHAARAENPIFHRGKCT